LPVSANLLEKIEYLGNKKLAQLKAIKTEFGSKSLGEVTVDQAIGGMRSIKCMITETSDLDVMTGIRYRGKTIEELRTELPKAEGGNEPLPEGLIWLLLTGTIPTHCDIEIIQQELVKRQQIPEHVIKTLSSLPSTMHPMTQLVIGVTALQSESKFAAAYANGMKKSEYWKKALDDALGVIAKIPIIAAIIYRRSFKDGKLIPARDDLDWSANYANMLGFGDEEFNELMRLYLFLHADHEGGNVSAHATHLVGSALSDPYLSMSAGLAGLAGPLHGLANQECLNWLMDTHTELKGNTPTEKDIVDIVQRTLAEGRVVPGFGHAVLRATDPRYTAQRHFALKHLPDAPLFKLVDVCFKAIPPALEKTGKVKNPWPNVDAHSGILLHHYGLTEADYYTVLFGVSRSIGVMSQLVWSRLLGLPIERPKSLTLDWIQNNFDV